MSLPLRSRLLLVGAAAALLGALALPLWRIGLMAPQYPEGLGLVIRLHTITGLQPQDLANINELNHYIGMKEIVPGAIPELRLMPWLVGVFAALALAIAAIGRRGAIAAWAVALGGLGAVGLYDFWRWEYDYGHNLDPHAAISIPGMTYQPPLLGAKALLNFTATSWPAAGAYLLGGAFALGAAAWWLARAPRPTPRAVAPVSSVGARVAAARA